MARHTLRGTGQQPQRGPAWAGAGELPPGRVRVRPGELPPPLGAAKRRGSKGKAGDGMCSAHGLSRRVQDASKRRAGACQAPANRRRRVVFFDFFSFVIVMLNLYVM